VERSLGAKRRRDRTLGILLVRSDDAYLQEDSEWNFADRKFVRHYPSTPDLNVEFLNSIVAE
jgi:hypothetical protein